MADERDRDQFTDERFGRRVHEGMNGGRSRNAHLSGENRALDADEPDRGDLRGDRADAAEPRRVDGDARGSGGYGDDTGFTGGSHAAGTSNTGGGQTGMNTGGETTGGTTNTGSTGGGAHGSHTAWAGTPAISRPEGVGHEALSGMEDLEHDEDER